MKWQDVRKQYPDTWLLIEALDAHTIDEKRRIVENLSEINPYTEFFMAMNDFAAIHKQEPNREMYVVHTVNEEIKIKVRFGKAFGYWQRRIRRG
ncbi:MAG: hypothetical protein IAF02_04920 [Anaerolineae bacterium]|nr:hypothetical protein [Anaerolineae bacterium]